MPQYVLKPSVVEECMWTLANASLHRHIPGYLCIRKTAGEEGRTDNLPFHYNEFFDEFFRIRDDSADKPFLVPFTQSKNPTRDGIWLNSNVAGTYAPSSIRPNQALAQVIENEEGGHNARWRLRDNHWELAREHLCEGNKIPIEALAGFLFRDYAITSDDPALDDLVTAFTQEFGYDRDGEEFRHLYSTGSIDLEDESSEDIWESVDEQ